MLYKDSVSLTPLIQVFRGRPLALRPLNLVLYQSITSSNCSYCPLPCRSFIHDVFKSDFIDLSFALFVVDRSNQIISLHLRKSSKTGEKHSFSSKLFLSDHTLKI